MYKKLLCFALLALLLSLVLVPAAAAQEPEVQVGPSCDPACCPEPAYRTIVVDGQVGDWAGVAVFGGLYQPGTGERLADLTLAYNCREGLLYVLVLSEEGQPVQESWAEAWLKLDYGSGAVVPVAKAWVRNTAGDAVGWEASFAVEPGVHFVRVHTNVLDCGWQTAVSSWLCVWIHCPPTPVVLAGYSVGPGNAGFIAVRWTTASEVGIIGFELWRNTWKNSNDQKIPLRAVMVRPPFPAKAPGSLTGASYYFLDRGAVAGMKYHYWLKTVESAPEVFYLGYARW